jgi:hypothetical protein
MPDIYLKAGESNPSDIKLVDPTIPIGGGPTWFGVLKYWTGSTWTKKVQKVWTGSWVNKPLKRWDGSAWKLVNNTGA